MAELSEPQKAALLLAVEMDGEILIGKGHEVTVSTAGALQRAGYGTMLRGGPGAARPYEPYALRVNNRAMREFGTQRENSADQSRTAATA